MRRLLGAALIALGASLAAAPGASAFEPQFVPGSVLTWPGGTADYSVNAASFTSVGLSDSVITASFNAWANDPLAALTLTRVTNVTGPAEADGDSDDVNEVELITTGWSDGAGVLGVTYVYFSGSQIAEADMYLNDQDFNWDDPTSGSNCGGRFDLGSTVTHEAGHFIGLGHSSEEQATCNPGSGLFDPVLCDATMFFSGGPCDTTGQSLACDDIAGLRYLYPPGGTRRADWVAQSFSSSPPPGAIEAGALIDVTGTAFNSGSLETSNGVAAVYVTTGPGSIAGGTRLLNTDALGQIDTCRSEAVSLQNLSFTAGQAGTRWLVVRLDDSTATPEYDEASNNLASIGPFTVSVSGPVLVVDPTVLEFDAVEGGAAPASQDVMITNGGSGSMTWNAADDRSWISLSRSSGTAGQGFAVTLDPAGLAVGRHVGTITVTSTGAAGSPATIAVGLDVTGGSILQVTPPSLAFAAAPGGALPASQQLAVSNTGTGTMAWTVSDDQPWLSVSPPSGSNGGTVTVSITTTSLAAGSHSGTITVTSAGAQGSPKTIPVTYDLSTAPPVLQVAPPSIAFSGAVGSSPASQQLSISNTGGGTLSFSATSNRSWLSASPASGAAPGSVTVSVSTSGLSAGTHSGAVTITSAGATGSPATIPVTLQLTNQPSLSASPGTIAFAAAAGTNPASRTLIVGNDGTGSLTYAIADDAAWLSLTPSSGATLSSGATRQHQLSVASSGLAAGNYQATVTVTAAGADDSPKIVLVTLEVGARPPLVVLPATLAFAATPAAPAPPAQSIAVSTSGATGATWTAVSDSAWLTVSPAQGIGDGTVTVSANGNGVAPGAHAGRVTISSATLAASPQVVDVSLSVEPGPRLVVSAGSARWSATRGGPLPSSLQVSVDNGGTGSLSWSITGTPGWLQVAPSSGAGASTITMTPTTTSLSPGRHSGVLSVVAPGAYDSPATIEVTYDILGPALAFTPERVRFELSSGAFVGPSSMSVAVGDVGGAGGAAWTAAPSVPWVTVTPSSGTVGQSVSVGLVDPSRLRPGVHDASIVFSSAGAANSPAPVPVSVIVRQPPGLSVHPASLDLVAVSGGGAQAAGALALDESGDRDGDWIIASHPAWLQPSALAGRSGDRVALVVDPAGLAAGSHAGTIVVTSGGESQDVPVELELRSAPAFVADSSAISLLARSGESSQAADVAVRNEGAGSAAFSATGNASWLRLAPASGNAPAILQIAADASALPPGTHRATVTVAGAAGSPALVEVTLAVAAAGAPLAMIDASAASGCAPLGVTFTDASAGSTSRTWRFEDGTTSAAASVTRSFDSPGEHAVELVAANAAGSSTARAVVIVRQPPLVHAGRDRVIAFEPDGETRLALEDARVVAAAPASIASLSWTTSRGTFEDSGMATSSLERPVLVLPSSRGGIEATLTLLAEDDSGCVASDTSRIRVRADVDLDGDTWNELVDNCPGLSNSLQGDQDADGVGSTCEPCSNAFDPSSADADASGTADACESAIARSASLPVAVARACDGAGTISVGASGAGRLRRIVLDLPARAPSSASAAGPALAAGGTGIVSGSRAELRVPAGIAPSDGLLQISVPVTSADDVLAVPCASARFGYAASDAVATCEDGELRLRPDGDLAPASAPNGVTDVADVVRLLRASVQLEVLDAEEAARADLAPGVATAGTWDASPDCRVDVADVVVALRAAVGLVTIAR